MSCWSTEQVLGGEATTGTIHEDRPKPGMLEARAWRRQVIRAFRRARARGETGMPPSLRATTGTARIDGLVPDGVARVVWRRGRTTQTVGVRDNHYGIATPIRLDGDRPALLIVDWLDADGKLLRSDRAMF